MKMLQRVLLCAVIAVAFAEPPPSPLYGAPSNDLQAPSGGDYSGTFGPIHVPSTNFQAPLQDTTLHDTYQAPQQRQRSGYSYRQQSDDYEQPSNTYLPAKPQDTYLPPQPKDTYLPPVQDTYQAPPRDSYQAPPRDSYQAPPRDSYQAPPRDSYQAPPRDSYAAPPQQTYRPPTPTKSSPVYIAPRPSTTPRTVYLPPSAAPRQQPSRLYGAPAVTGAVFPSQQYGAPSRDAPSQQYGAPARDSLSTQYGPPSRDAGYGYNSNSQDDYNEQDAKYEFEYNVKDEPAALDFGHKESRDGTRTEGRYFVLLPDGRKQIVTYYADETGYHPTITYEDTGAANGGYNYPSSRNGNGGNGGYSYNGY